MRRVQSVIYVVTTPETAWTIVNRNKMLTCLAIVLCFFIQTSTMFAQVLIPHVRFGPVCALAQSSWGIIVAFEVTGRGLVPVSS